MRPERAEVVGELVRQHGRDEAGDVSRERSSRRAVVERRSRRNEVRDVGDVHPCADPVRLAAERQRVVEVLRGVGVDRERREVAEVDPAVERRERRVVRLELDAGAALDQQRLQHVLDPPRGAERAQESRATATRADEREVAGVEIAESLRLEDDRDAGREVRLADDEPSASRNLDDDPVHARSLRMKARRSPASSPRARFRRRLRSGTGGSRRASAHASS